MTLHQNYIDWARALPIHALGATVTPGTPARRRAGLTRRSICRIRHSSNLKGFTWSLLEVLGRHPHLVAPHC